MIILNNVIKHLQCDQEPHKISEAGGAQTALTLLCEPCVMVAALKCAGLAALQATLSSNRKPRKNTSDTMT